MADKAIIVEGLSKKYSIGVRHRRFPTLRDSIARATQARINQARAMFRRRNEEEQNEEPEDLSAPIDKSVKCESCGDLNSRGDLKKVLLDKKCRKILGMKW